MYPIPSLANQWTVLARLPQACFSAKEWVSRSLLLHKVLWKWWRSTISAELMRGVYPLGSRRRPNSGLAQEPPYSQ